MFIFFSILHVSLGVAHFAVGNPRMAGFAFFVAALNLTHWEDLL